MFSSYFLDNTVKISLIWRLIVYNLPYNILHIPIYYFSHGKYLYRIQNYLCKYSNKKHIHVYTVRNIQQVYCNYVEHYIISLQWTFQRKF